MQGTFEVAKDPTVAFEIMAPVYWDPVRQHATRATLPRLDRQGRPIHAQDAPPRSWANLGKRPR